MLQPFQEAHVDTIALGCTHYPFVEQQIGDIMGKNVQLLDSGAAIARQVQRVLEQNTTLSQDDAIYNFYTTGNHEKFEKIAKMLMKKEVYGKIGMVEEICL